MSIDRFGSETYIQIGRLQVGVHRNGYKPLFSVRYGYCKGPHLIRLGAVGDVTWRLLGKQVSA
jgi:hypothetical protein